MTMAEWACRGLMGLGPTTHVESAQLPEFTALAQSDGSAPDLCGQHWTDSSPLRLVEAKGKYKLGQPILDEGWEQLRQGSLEMADPHRLVLCGTSLYEHLFMTIDHVARGHSDAAKVSMPGRPDPEEYLGEDGEALLQAAQSQLLLYLHLRYGRGAGLRLVPLSPWRSAGPPARPGRLTPLEDDPATAEVRQRVRAMHPDERRSMRRRREFVDFIVGSVGPTGVRLGMSRRLFAACERLFMERRQTMDLVDQSLGTASGPPHTAPERIPHEAEGEVPLEPRKWIPQEPEHFTRRVLAPREDLLPEEPAWVALERERFLHYQENEYQEHGRIRDEVRNAYWGAEDREWPQLLGGVEPGFDLDDDSLEAATAETYIAIQSSDPLLTTDAPR